MIKNTVLMLLVAAFVALFVQESAYAEESAAEAVHGWALDRMATWSPPGHSFYPDAKESEEDGLSRYNDIVRDAMAVAYDPAEAPLFSNDKIGRAKTLAVMLAIADSESGGYRKDVDFGTGKLSRGDGGKSWCLMQVQTSKAGDDGRTQTRIGLKGETYEYFYDKSKGYGGEDLVANRKTCFRVALHMARESFKACWQSPVEDRLSVYAGGDCTVGRAASRVRVGKAIRWLAQKAPPNADTDLSGFYPSTKLAAN